MATTIFGGLAHFMWVLLSILVTAFGVSCVAALAYLLLRAALRSRRREPKHATPSSLIERLAEAEKYRTQQRAAESKK